MAGQTLDLIVVGAGSGGVRAARMAADRGARVAVIEAGATGGTCVNVGCIPKKLYSHAAHYAQSFIESEGYGWRGEAPVLDWAVLKARRAAEIQRLNAVYEQLLAASGVRLVRGRARMVSPQAVEVSLAGGGVDVLEARHVLIATGSMPMRSDLPGGERAVVSDAMFDLPQRPRHLVVVGGGYIACEMASIFHGLGAQVTQLVRGEALLRGFDAEAAAFLAAEMGKKGVQIRFGRRARAIEATPQGLSVQLDDGGAIEADTVLMATGRAPNTAGLGLQEVGVRLSARGAVEVDALGRSNLPTVHAVGDVTDGPQLTPVALAQAMVVVDRLFGHGDRRFDPALVPTAVFTDPGVGTIGLSEEAARARHGRVKVFRSDFRPLRHTLSGSSERCLVKLVVDAQSDRVLGLHMVGAEAGEVVQGFAVAIGMGATKAQFDATIGIHPTLAEEFVTLRQPVREA